MNRKTKTIIVWVVVLLLVAVGILFFAVNSKKTDKLDGFVKCLTEKGAVFYGAFWCQHCQTQKTMFGESEKLLSYVECSTPDGNGQLSVCQEKNIEGYPTWEFQDGSRESGKISLETLSEKTGCLLP